MAGGRLTKKESDQKKRQGKKMFINGFSQNEIADVLEVHLETIKRWYKKYDWQDAKDIHSLSISELKQETLRSFAALKAGETPKVSPDQLSKLSSTFEKLSDKKKNLAYMYDNFEELSDAILKDALSERLKKNREAKLEMAKYLRGMMDEVVSKTYKEALND